MNQNNIISVRVFHNHKLPVIHEHRTVLGLFNRYDPLPVVANPSHDIPFTSGLARNRSFCTKYQPSVPVAGNL